MQEAIDFHLEGLRKEGYEIPQASSTSAYVEVIFTARDKQRKIHRTPGLIY